MKKVTISTQVQETIFSVAELISKDIKPHTIGETFILPGSSVIVRARSGPGVESEIKKSLSLNVTMSR